MIARFFASQARKPRGPLGRYLGNSWAKGNVYEVAWTVSLLDIQPDDHVLEVGFGPGVGIQLVSQKAVRGMTAGLDLSGVMVQMARERNAGPVRAGRVDLKQGDIAALPYDDDAFDKAFAVHCIYFWRDPIHCMEELRRVLKARGSAAITMLPKSGWQRIPPPEVFSLYEPGELEKMMTDSGFRNVRVERGPQPEKFPGVCVLGIK